jgi:hypothetical protein
MLSNWPFWSAHQKTPMMANTSRIEMGISKYKMSMVKTSKIQASNTDRQPWAMVRPQG